MDWKQGYTSTIRLYLVNQSTWGDGDEITGLVSASITKDKESSLIEDSNITLDGTRVNGYVRLVLEAKNNSEMAREPLGTFLVTSPKRSINGKMKTMELESYSVLKPASDKVLPPGWYFPEGGDPVAGAFELLSETLMCPIEPAESDIRTNEPKIAESNETVLSMALYLLSDTDYAISIDGRGCVTINKKKDDIVAIFDTYENDVLMPEITDESDIFDIPNVLRVSDSNGNYETIYNDDENSNTSIQKLGWEKWASEQLTLDYGESLLEKGSERMEELSKTVRKISYSREFDPNIKVNDVALYLLPQQGIVGKFRVISQSYTIGNGVKVSEIAEFESYNWRA